MAVRALAAEPAVKCMVCIKDTSDCGLMKEIRCAHNICMECFEDLRKRNITDCPECRRVIRNDDPIEEVSPEGPWFEKREITDLWSGSKNIDLIFVVQRMHAALKEGEFGFTKLDIIEIVLEFMKKTHAKMEEISKLKNSDSGVLVRSTSSNGGESLILCECAPATKRQMREVMKASEDEIFKSLMGRKVTYDGVTRPLVPRDGEARLKEMFRTNLDVFVDIAAQKIVTPPQRFNVWRVLIRAILICMVLQGVSSFFRV